MTTRRRAARFVAVLALGALPAAEAAALRAHVETCEQCRVEYRELRGAADAVGYAAEAEAAELDQLRAARMRSNVCAPFGPAVNPRVSRRAPPRRPSPRAVQPWIAYLAIAASLVVAFLSAANNAALRSQRDAGLQQLATLRQSLEEQTKTSNDLRTA